MSNNSGGIIIIRNPKDSAEGAGGADFEGPADSLPTEPLFEDEWPEPEMPRNPLLPVPAFTRDMLPPVRADRVFDVATNMQCPPDFVAVPLVIDLGLVVGRKVRVRPNRGSWFVVPNLWGYVVSRPGTKKSPAILAAHDAIDRLQEAVDQAYEAPRAAYDQLRVQRRLSLQAVLHQARQLELGSEAQQNIQRQIAELSAEIAPPVRRQYVTNDSTIEAFGELLSVNQNGMGMYNDELSAFFAMLDDPSRGRDRSFYISSWAGNERAVVNRIAAGRSIVIPALCISVFGGIQPDRLRRHLVEAENSNDGLAPRFQLGVYPDPVMPVKGWRPEPDNISVRDGVRALFARLDREPLLGLRTDEDLPYVIFAPDAQEVFDSWVDDIEIKAADDDREDIIRSYLSKYKSMVPSLALLFHLAQAPASENVTMIPLRALTMALKWADYLEQHLARIYQSRLTGTKSVTTARRIISKIKGKQLQSGFTVRDITQRDWSGLMSGDEVRVGLSVLEGMDWLRKQEATSGARGGRPTNRWAINPRVFDQTWGEVGPIEGEEEERL